MRAFGTLTEHKGTFNKLRLNFRETITFVCVDFIITPY